MKNNLLILFLIFIMSSCVSLKPARSYEKAEVKVRKFNTGIQNQIERFPSLSDIAYKTVIKDTVFIPSKSTDLTVDLINTDSLISLNKQYKEWLQDRQYIIDSILNKPLPSYTPNCDIIVNELRNRISIINRQYQDQKEQSLFYLDKYNSIVTNPTKGIYEDSLFIVKYEYINGSINIQPTVKENYVIRDKTLIGYDIDIRRHFWQDVKFWGFLILILNIFYFFNDLVYKFLNSIFTAITKLIRKIFIKI